MKRPVYPFVGSHYKNALGFGKRYATITVVVPWNYSPECLTAMSGIKGCSRVLEIYFKKDKRNRSGCLIKPEQRGEL